MEKERSTEVEEAKAAKAASEEVEARYQRKVMMLQGELKKSKAHAKSIADAAEAKIKKMTGEFNTIVLKRKARIEQLNSEVSGLKAQILEDARAVHEKMREKNSVIERLEREAGENPRLRSEMAKLNEDLAKLKEKVRKHHQRSKVYLQTIKQLKAQANLIPGLERRAEIRATKLKLENAWYVVKTRLNVLKECKEGIPDLDAKIAKAEADGAAAQQIIDNLPSSSDEDENSEGEVGERPEGNTAGELGEDNAEDDDNAEEGNP